MQVPASVNIDVGIQECGVAPHYAFLSYTTRGRGSGSIGALAFSGVDGTGLSRYTGTAALPPAISTLAGIEQYCAPNVNTPGQTQAVLTQLAFLVATCRVAKTPATIAACVALETLVKNGAAVGCLLDFPSVNDVKVAITAVTYRYELLLGEFDASEDISFGVITENLVNLAPPADAYAPLFLWCLLPSTVSQDTIIV